MRPYSESLIMSVMDKSCASTWQEAVKEWEVIDCEEDESNSTDCVCGKEGIRYLFTIRNALNGNTLFPIGSTCIKKFGRAELDEETSIKEQEFILYHAVQNNEFLTLKNGQFSRKLLRHLYDCGAFAPTRYNDYDPYNDYQFLVDMFNKRTPSEAQLKKATAIILTSIKPFIIKKLKNKVK